MASRRSVRSKEKEKGGERDREKEENQKGLEVAGHRPELTNTPARAAGGTAAGPGSGELRQKGKRT